MAADSLTRVFLVLTGCVLAWALWRAGRPRPLFRIRVRDGVPRAAEGTVTPAFLQRVKEVAAAHAISSGVVSGYAHGSFIRLHFSPEICEPARQQLRNWWASFGWTAPRAGQTTRCG